jgi:hypothetical protein
VNSVNTVIQCVTNASLGCADLTHTVTVSVGDEITVDVQSDTNEPAVWSALLN